VQHRAAVRPELRLRAGVIQALQQAQLQVQQQAMQQQADPGAYQ
jgi:hypothetical protein